MTTNYQEYADSSTYDAIHARDMLLAWREQYPEEESEPRIEFPTIEAAIEFSAQRLLYSQRLFIFSEYLDTLAISGVGTGKTLSGITRGVLQSYMIPDNYGLFVRDTEKNLISTTQKDFLDLAGGLIIEQNKGEGWVKMPSIDGRPSTVAFRYLQSSKPGNKHLSGLNLGWYSAGQLEDCMQDDWDYLNTRLRRAVARRARWADANPKGRDWLYKRYIEPAEKAKRRRYRKTMVPGKLGEQIPVEEWRASPDLYAIRSPTEENIHLPDGFIEDMLRTRSKEYIERYVRGSFEEWGGRIYKSYSYDSIHNIDAFPIPKDWPTFVWIDVGGDVPWAIMVARMDPYLGDVFITHELYDSDLLPHTIIDWLREPTNGAVDNGRQPRTIIDPENKPVVGEFFRYGHMVEAARKGAKVGGILHVLDYLRQKPGRVRVLPQPDGMGGFAPREFTEAPHLWVFKRCENWRREHGAWAWLRDPRTNLPTNRPEDKDDHTCDATIYGLRILPPIQKLPQVDKDLEILRKHDYSSYREAKAIRDARTGQNKNRADLSEFYSDTVDYDAVKKALTGELNPV